MKTLKKFIFNEYYSSKIGALFFSFWIGQRIYFNYTQLFRFSLNALIWWLITFQFVLFILSYLTRIKAREQACGFIESVFPFICAALPFALLVKHPYLPPTHGVYELRSASILLVIGGTLLISTGVLFLRKSFSIMTEVRKPVFSGVYRITRHPMYLGSMMTSLGALFQNMGWLNCILFILFCACQIYRAIREEKKIIKIFSEYRTYASEVGWIWKWGRIDRPDL